MSARIVPVLLVAVGGAAGAVARLSVGDAFARRLGSGWPYGTLFINASGCFLIALFLAGPPASWGAGWRYLVPVGFVGAYTTFSTYAWETLRLVESGRLAAAAAYVAISNLVGFGAVILGGWLARRV